MMWSTLPSTFRRSVIKKLDYKSRCRLRKCSRADLELVDSCALNLLYVEIGVGKDGMVYLAVDEDDDGYCVNTKDSPPTHPTDAISDFISIFRHPKSIVTCLYFAQYEPAQTDIEKVINELYQRLLDSKLTLRANEIRWILESSSGEQFLSVFKLLEPKFIEKIDILYSFPPELMIKVCETPQWKSESVKECTIYGKYNFTKIENFCGENVKQIILSCETYTPHDVLTVIEAWQQKPLHAIFLLYSIDFFDIDDILRNFGTVKHEPILENDQFARHVQKFPVKNNDDLVLVVKLDSVVASGVVCRKTCLEEDLNNLNLW